MQSKTLSGAAFEIEENDDARAMRAVAILAWSQAVLGSLLPVNFILGGLAGQRLAENPAFGTLPISVIVLGTMVSAPAVSAIMGRFGRRAGFLIGACAGVAGALIAAQAIVVGSFVLLLGGSLVTGIYMAAHNFYRFAATDLARRPSGRRPCPGSWRAAWPRP